MHAEQTVSPEPVQVKQPAVQADEHAGLVTVASVSPYPVLQMTQVWSFYLK